MVETARARVVIWAERGYRPCRARKWTRVGDIKLGRDMSRWKAAGHFVSWLALCPDNDIRGGRVLWRATRRVHNRAGDLFRMAAYSLHRDQSQLGDTERERRFEARLKRQAQQLGYKLVPIEERPAA